MARALRGFDLSATMRGTVDGVNSAAEVKRAEALLI